MNKTLAITELRKRLRQQKPVVGSWIQIPHSSIAEILGASGYDWVAVDMEHGAVSHTQLPDIFRALELGETLPLVRLAEGTEKECKQALDAGAAGVIIPMVGSAVQLSHTVSVCRWPPAGHRGVAFSRANMFGENFQQYFGEAQAPLIIAMIESREGVKNIDEILQVEGLDAIFIGPYDLSASIGLTGNFEHPDFAKEIKTITDAASRKNIPLGIHVVEPSIELLRTRIAEGYQFLAYSMDSVILSKAARYDGI